MAEYRTGSHTRYDIQYHFVWVAKYGYHVLRGEVAERARELRGENPAANEPGVVADFHPELIRQSCMSRDVKILKGHVSKEHVQVENPQPLVGRYRKDFPPEVHLLVSCPPMLSPAKVMQYLKGRSSRLLQEEFPHLKKRYWGQHLWARGYFCATVGVVTDEQIKAYIAAHDEEPPEENFKISE